MADKTWINKTWHNKTWNNKTWSDKTFINKIWREKTWINKTWHNKTWSDKTWLKISDEHHTTHALGCIGSYMVFSIKRFSLAIRYEGRLLKDFC